MAQVQTDGSGLRLAVETVKGAVTVPTSGWELVEYNGIQTPGNKFKKEPRRPISPSLQYRAPMLTDLDSGFGLELDITAETINLIAPAAFRSRARHSGGTGQSFFRPTAVTSTGYTVPALGALPQRTLVFARGFANAANNGLKLVGASSTSIEIKVSGLVAEASPPAGARLEVAGFRFISGEATLDDDGNLVTSTTDLTTLGLDAEQWIQLGGRLDDATFSPLDPQFRGAAEIVSVAAHKLTTKRRSWVVDQHASLDLGPLTTTIDTVIEAIERGAAGNAITVAIVADAGAAAGSISEVGTAITFHIKTSATATTVAQFEALVAQSTLVRVKTPDGTGGDSLVGGDALTATALAGGDKGPDAGTGKQVEIYYGRWYRHVPVTHADFLDVSYAAELELPDLFGAGTPGYLYMLGNVLGELKWNLPLAGKATMSLTFVGTRSLDPTDTRKDGPEDAIEPVAVEGMSTATDLQRVRFDGLDEAGILTDCESLSITMNNNVTARKKLGKLGAFTHDRGDAMVMSDGKFYFTDPTVITAVRTNVSATMDVLLRNADGGALLDLQRVKLDSSDLELEKNKAAMIASKATGFQHNLSTASLSIFPFLPALPEEAQ